MRCNSRKIVEAEEDKNTIYLNHTKRRQRSYLVPLRDFKTVYVSDGFQSLGRQKSLDARVDLRREEGSTGGSEGMRIRRGFKEEFT